MNKMNLELDMEKLSKEELMALKNDLENNLDEYTKLDKKGIEIDPELLFKTQSCLLMIDELLSA
ncbi:hypothetical protein [Helicobacter cappadocius]|uniref:Uncharacterized protein n=1 Tax=Helicobacter cappadocius TaxID=3063998 RepID=A0AA90T4W6_9HELI|nr:MULTISPECIES: hypothetical protein [unclassified Helicobacter]MDO7253066.1 hypothetical protein [Helicobacter sp. faydin-H75]MDP2538808.1 hypothetical protein [Helicobacter sp. faydin-H76]